MKVVPHIDRAAPGVYLVTAQGKYSTPSKVFYFRVSHEVTQIIVPERTDGLTGARVRSHAVPAYQYHYMIAAGDAVKAALSLDGAVDAYIVTPFGVTKQVTLEQVEQLANPRYRSRLCEPYLAAHVQNDRRTLEHAADRFVTPSPPLARARPNSRRKDSVYADDYNTLYNDQFSASRSYPAPARAARLPRASRARVHVALQDDIARARAWEMLQEREAQENPKHVRTRAKSIQRKQDALKAYAEIYAKLSDEAKAEFGPPSRYTVKSFQFLQDLAERAWDRYSYEEAETRR